MAILAEGQKVESLLASPPQSEHIWSFRVPVAYALDLQTPKCWTGRFLMNLWAIFCLLVLSSYTANLAAVMVGEKTFEQVSGIHDDKVRLESRRARTRCIRMPSNPTHRRANEQRAESLARD